MYIPGSHRGRQAACCGGSESLAAFHNRSAFRLSTIYINGRHRAGVKPRVPLLYLGILFNQKLIKTSRREAPVCGAKRRIRAPRARSARGASQLCVSKKSFCFLWIRACTTKRECSPRGRCGFGDVRLPAYTSPGFYVALFKTTIHRSTIKINKQTQTQTHAHCDCADQFSTGKCFAVHVCVHCNCISYYISPP